MKRPFVIADLFCGAGGSTSGAVKAIKELGRRVVIACVNHWPVAIATHQRNHPEARHYIEDVTAADPHKIVPEGYLDLLMASPECRFYSRARGGKPVHDQGRMNPWVVQKWLTALKVKSLLVENVPEFVSWGPLLADGRPDPKRRGMFFQAWFQAIQALGYRAEWRYLNAADYGDATTRVRFFLLARRDRKPIRWPEATHYQISGSDMFGERRAWRSAKEIIDWSNLGRSLLDDPRYIRKPLSEKTRRRIARGLEKFGGPLAPMYIQLLGLDASDTTGSDLVQPFILNRNGDNGCDRAHSVENPMPTATGRGAGYLIQPFIMGKQGHNPAYRSADEPIPTATTESRSVLIQPFILGQQSGGAARSSEEPIPTVAADGAISLINPVILGQHKGVVRSSNDPLPTCATHGGISLSSPLMVKYYGTGICHTTEEPVPAVTTKDRIGLANPMIVPYRGEREGQAPRCHSVDEPVPAITTEPGFALANPVLIEVNHNGDVDRSQSPGEPLKTITSKRGTGLVNPFLVQWDQTGWNGNGVRSVEEPVPTIVTKQNTGVVEPTLLVEPVLQHAEGRNIDPRRLVMVNGEPFILDIRFRMLANIELARAMGFSDEESTYEFVGNVAEVTRQIGNAVPVRLAKALVKVILE